MSKAGFTNNILGIGFLEQATPELVLVRGTHVNKSVLKGRESVIHHNLNPFTLLLYKVSLTTIVFTTVNYVIVMECRYAKLTNGVVNEDIIYTRY